MHREAIDPISNADRARKLYQEKIFPAMTSKGDNRLTQRSLDLLSATYPNVDWSSPLRRSLSAIGSGVYTKNSTPPLWSP